MPETAAILTPHHQGFQIVSPRQILRRHMGPTAVEEKGVSLGGLSTGLRQSPGTWLGALDSPTLAMDTSGLWRNGPESVF